MIRLRMTIVGGALVGSAVGCKPQQPAGASASEVAQAKTPQVSYVLRSPEGPVPGMGVSYVQAVTRDPYDRDQGAIEEGRFLYVRMNCAYCHGFDGKGGMGPDLTDDRWRYGANDADVFSSIFRGRAKGMPAWGEILTQDQIWELVAYVRALGGMNPARYRLARPGQESETRKSAVNAGDY